MEEQAIQTSSAQQQSPKTSVQSQSNENKNKALTGKIIGHGTEFVRQECLMKIEELKSKSEFDEITYHFLIHAINFFGDALLRQGTHFIQ